MSEKYDELLAAIKRAHKLHNLGDAIYEVRERADKTNLPDNVSTWDHPDVKSYSDAVAVIERHIKGEAGGWQPIATAPKDGTRVWLHAASYGPFVGYWHAHAFKFPGQIPDRWQAETGERVEPTHWQPRHVPIAILPD